MSFRGYFPSSVAIRIFQSRHARTCAQDFLFLRGCLRARAIAPDRQRRRTSGNFPRVRARPRLREREIGLLFFYACLATRGKRVGVGVAVIAIVAVAYLPVSYFHASPIPRPRAITMIKRPRDDLSRSNVARATLDLRAAAGRGQVELSRCPLIDAIVVRCCRRTGTQRPSSDRRERTTRLFNSYVPTSLSHASPRRSKCVSREYMHIYMYFPASGYVKFSATWSRDKLRQTNESGSSISDRFQ